MPQRKLMTSLMLVKLSACAVLCRYASLATRESARRTIVWHCCPSRRDGQYVGARQMPTLRSSTFSTESLPTCASHVNITADAQQDPVSLPDQKKQAENLKPKSRPAGRKRLRPVASADEPVNEAAKIASGPDVAAQSAAVKKPKVRKALLTTLWTEEDLLPLKVKAERLYDQLNQLYKDPPCPLTYQTPFQLLVAVILSAQTTDKKVNQVTPALFELAPDAARMANMEIAEVQELIRQVGLAPTKAKNICNMSKMLMDGHDGVVPQTFDTLEQLPGVGHKTASVVICTAFGCCCQRKSGTTTTSDSSILGGSIAQLSAMIHHSAPSAAGLLCHPMTSWDHHLRRHD